MWRSKRTRVRFVLLAWVGMGVCGGRLFAADPAAYRDAQSAIESGRWDDALAITTRLLSASPHDAEALTLKGFALTGRHELQAADEAFEQALTVRPGLARARKQMAVNQLSLKQPAIAEKNLQILLKETPDDPAIRMYLGEIAFRRKDYRSASTYLQAVDKYWGADQRLPVMMADCDFQLARTKEAIGILEGVDGTGLNAIWQFHAGSLLAAHQEFAAAIRFFEAARANYPEPYDVLFNLGLCYTETRNFQQAVTILGELREKGNETAEVDNLLAEAYEGEQHSDEAADLLRRAIELAPNDERNYVDLATICADHNDFERGLQVIDAGLHHVPDSDALLVQQAVIYAMTGRYEESEKDFLAASHSDAVRGPALAGLGLTYIQKGDVAQAVAVLRQRAKQVPNNGPVQYLLGEALIRSGIGPSDPDWAEAIAALEKAVRLNPRFVHSRIDLAKLYLRENKNADGIRELRAAVEIDPTKVQAFALLAAALKKEGKADEASIMFARVRELNALSRSRIHSVASSAADSGSTPAAGRAR